MTEIRSYEQANEYLGKKDSRPLRYKTRVNRRGENIAITHHDTDIITYQPSGSVIIDTQGWHTSTTKERLNNYLPIIRNNRWSQRIYQEDSIWYIEDGYRNSLVFADGMKLLPDGTIEGAGPPVGQLKKLNKEILKYSRNYIKALFAGKVGKPGPGDCWYCVMRTDKVISKEPLIVQGRMVSPSKETLGEATRNTDHLLSHFEEKYYVPSLLVRAIEVFRVSQWAMWALGELWGEMDNTHGFGDNLVKQQLRSSLRRYLRRQLGLAS